VGEARRLGVAEPPRDLLDGERAGRQQLLGQGGAHLVDQRTEGRALLAQPASQRPVAHRQPGGDLVERGHGARGADQLVAHDAGDPRPRAAPLDQLAALALGHRGGQLVGLGERQVERVSVEHRDVAGRVELRRHTEQRRPGLGVGRRGEPDGEALQREPGGQLAGQRAHPGEVAGHHEGADVARHVVVVQAQVHLGAVLLDGEPAEGERQVDEGRPHRQGVADRRAAGQRETPDAVGRQVVARARREGEVGVGAGRLQVAQQGELLPAEHLRAGRPKQVEVQAGACQDRLGGHPPLDRQARQQQRAGRAAPVVRGAAHATILAGTVKSVAAHDVGERRISAYVHCHDQRRDHRQRLRRGGGCGEAAAGRRPRPRAVRAR
jgi:hypothetical protein